MLKINKIYNEDCLVGMKKIDNKSIDMILADLPYGSTNCQWDTIIPLELLWDQYKRIIKDNGAIVLTAQTPFDKILGCSNIKQLRYEWIWEKTQATGYLNAKKMPMKAHENILIFYKKLPVFNPQKTTGHKPVNTYTKKVNIANKTQIYGKVKSDISGGGETCRYPRSVQVFSSDKQKTKIDGTIHSTQKPIALFEYLIKTYTNEDDLVLDNVIGSGTTAIACINTNRNFIGFELNKEYFDVANKRILKYKKITKYLCKNEWF